MTTSMHSAQSRTTSGRGQGSGRARDTQTETGSWSEDSSELLTAALIGAAVGAGTAFLLQQGWRHRDGVRVLARGATRMARRPGRGSGRARHLAERLDLGDAREQIHDAVEAVRDALGAELRDFRKSLRRKRRRFGL